MPNARVFTPENPLSKVVQTTGGAGANELIASAEKRVADLGPSIRAYVFERVKAILAIVDDPSAAATGTAEIGAAAMKVAEVAGAVGLASLGEVARGISAMVEAAGPDGAPRPDAFALHIDALRLLDRSGGHIDGEEQMLARLRALRTAVGVPE